MGPRLELCLRRSQAAAPEVESLAMKQPKTSKKKVWCLVSIHTSLQHACPFASYKLPFAVCCSASMQAMSTAGWLRKLVTRCLIWISRGA